jgi:regulator of replication initiation timing
MMTNFFRTNQSSKKQKQALAFDGLNPLLAKQLSELEYQIGQLAQVQFDLSQERERMRIEMDALRAAVLVSTAEGTPDMMLVNEGSQ